MGKKFLVLHHLGLGDHFVMNGFIHFLRLQEKPEEILLVVKEHNLKTVVKMYEGCTEIDFYPIKDMDDLYPKEEPHKKIAGLIDQGYLYIGFGVHGNNNKYLELDTSWANCFYKQMGLDSSIRFKLFHFPSNLEPSVAIVKAVVEKVGPKYIVIHDDPSRGFVLKYSAIKRFLKEDSMEELPIIYLGKDRYKMPLIDGGVNPDVGEIVKTETLYDYCHLLANATACHMMDSSVALLLDLLQTKEGQKRYMHEYAKVGEILSTENLFQKDWLRLTDAHV